MSAAPTQRPIPSGIEADALLEALDAQRLALSAAHSDEEKARWSRYLTPLSTACFMAGLFSDVPDAAGTADAPRLRILDASAGIGVLSAALLARWTKDGTLSGAAPAEVTALELDPRLTPALTANLSRFPADVRVLCGDFLEVGSAALGGGHDDGHPAARALTPGFTHAVLNPPYRKIRSDSRERRLLRAIPLETVNLYAGFLALALALLAPGGELVAIIPRSFTNGLYYKPFRTYLLAHAVFRHVHVFETRDRAFRDDGVLQETVIIHLRKFDPGETTGTADQPPERPPVTLTRSTDDAFADLTAALIPQNAFVRPEDPERFFRLPFCAAHGSGRKSGSGSSSAFTHTLAELGITVSTGPVVPFRSAEDLLAAADAPGAAPLIQPNRIRGLVRSDGSAGTVEDLWVRRPGGDAFTARRAPKPEGIRVTPATRRQLWPMGFYAVVRRFSAKEEPRRVVAAVTDPGDFPGHGLLAFENHVNVFHAGKTGLPKTLAVGLAVCLNVGLVDRQVRAFSGHTQVNAADLKALRYPSWAALMRLGKWALRRGTEPLDAEEIDEALRSLFGGGLRPSAKRSSSKPRSRRRRSGS